MTNFYDGFKESLGKVGKKYFDVSVKKETETLRRLDDILDELAMMRRVQEDIRLVYMDVYDETAAKVDRLVERGRSKLNRLEGDALRVRQSVRKLQDPGTHLSSKLSLEANLWPACHAVELAAAGGQYRRSAQLGVPEPDPVHLHSRNRLLRERSRPLPFYSCSRTGGANRRQAPLSWVTSLLALTIEGFTPDDDSGWSKRAVAAASCKFTKMPRSSEARAKTVKFRDLR